MTNPDLGAVIATHYPKSVDCLSGHIGPTTKSWFWEYDDDRGYLMIVPRCEHCGMPVGGDDYATREQQAAYDRGERPCM